MAGDGRREEQPGTVVHLRGTLERALFAGHAQLPHPTEETDALSDPVSGDLDAEGEAVGVEVLGVSSA